MKSLTTNKSAKAKNDEIIILSFNDKEEDIDQLILEMQEEERLSKENQASELYSEILMLNRISLNSLSRVA
jgi:hypothetical protein